ncbi:hypothetical protein BJV82DRAFT_318168 [Fennellomyces sp. T-0311]|nr:hypothetical protein BJV82DRAFT_318168 [Fennellomyces sp. T-0311]
MFGKGAIDSDTTTTSVTLQIHGFHIRFYLAELKHEAMYILTEIAHIQVPDSLDTISSLLSMTTLDTLVRLNDLIEAAVSVDSRALQAT